MQVTVAICTWNRAVLLDQTLAEMGRLRIPAGVEWELLVVNNNCTDETDLVVGQHASRLPIRCVFEPRPGLSNARNCAIKAARGRLIVWTDDDVLVSANWLAEYTAAAKESPGAAFFGGPIEPFFEGPPPDWIAAALSSLEGVFALRDLGKRAFDVDENSLPFGANFAVRAEVQRRYRYDPRLGRVKQAMLSGEETCLLQKMLADGLRGRWVPEAKVRHYVPKDRLTARYVRSFFLGLGRTDALTQASGGKPARRRLFKKAVESELKYRLRRRFSKPEKWVNDFIRSSYLWGRLSYR